MLKGPSKHTIEKFDSLFTAAHPFEMISDNHLIIEIYIQTKFLKFGPKLDLKRSVWSRARERAIMRSDTSST